MPQFVISYFIFACKYTCRCNNIFGNNCRKNSCLQGFADYFVLFNSKPYILLCFICTQYNCYSALSGISGISRLFVTC